MNRCRPLFAFVLLALAASPLALGSPHPCGDSPDPGLYWRCHIVQAVELGPTLNLFGGEAACFDQATIQAAPWTISKEGQVLEFVVYGRHIEGCTPGVTEQAIEPAAVPLRDE